LGERVGDQYIVLEGLEEGEMVVKNGAFKLDSAAQLADKLSMMNRNPGSGANRSGHEGHIIDSSPVPIEALSPTTGEDHSSHMKMETDSVPDAFKAQLQLVVEEYLKLKNALIQSNPGEASEAATFVLEAINKTDMMLLKGEDHMEWMRFLGTLTPEAEAISNSSSLVEQRASFVPLSLKLIESVKHFEIPGIYYQQFCPMSNDGDGAYWLSKKSDIENPYFGDQMHSCGETITKIEF
jgi:Cu(I)/Ag(I) efflux system membrane fusion protein